MILRSISISRRIVVTVLLLELLSAAALIIAVAINEHHVELRAFDARLAGTAESLMGGVQDAEDIEDNVVLDAHRLRLDKDAVYRVEDERGRVLGTSADAAHPFQSFAGSPGFHDAIAAGRRYRFFVLHGVRIVDPDAPNGGKSHNITILYGTPVRHVWHEVLEAIRFFAIATALLLGVTTIVMALLVRRHLAPVHELAREADRISLRNWQFDAPIGARERVELRPLANALESALARVQLSFEQQKRFTSDAAHELKTDVAIVKSSLQLLSMRKRTADEYDQGLALILRDFTRLESTVQNLLDLARLEQPADSDRPGRLPPSCSLRNAVEEAVQQCAPLGELKGIEVILDLASEAPVPLESRDAFLLCSNILVNALQHSREGGKVRVRLVRGDGHNGNIVVLTVQDWGEGISEPDLPFLFNAFYRGDISRSRKSGGTGLGLSICKAISDRVGGTIEISNHEAGGAVVTVSLPVSG